MSEQIPSRLEAEDVTRRRRVATNWRDLSIHSYIKIVIIAGLLFYIFQNEIWRIVRRWFTDPSWSHGILIPFFSFYFLNQHKEQILTRLSNPEAGKVHSRPNYLGLILLLLTLLFYIFNTVQFRRGYLNGLTVIASMASIGLFLGGWGLFRYFWFPVGFLVFAVPLPSRIYRALTIPMRQWAATVASAVLNLVKGLEATAHGVVIDVFYKGQLLDPPLDVAEACSGMRLLMAFVALGVVMAYLHYRPFWQRLILLLSTVPIAIFCNIIRVTVTGFIYILISPKYSQGIYHDFLGILMLGVAFAIYAFLAWFMAGLFIDTTEPGATEKIIVRRK